MIVHVLNCYFGNKLGDERSHFYSNGSYDSVTLNITLKIEDDCWETRECDYKMNVSTGDIYSYLDAKHYPKNWTVPCHMKDFAYEKFISALRNHIITNLPVGLELLECLIGANNGTYNNILTNFKNEFPDATKMERIRATKPIKVYTDDFDFTNIIGTFEI